MLKIALFFVEIASMLFYLFFLISLLITAITGTLFLVLLWQYIKIKFRKLFFWFGHRAKVRNLRLKRDIGNLNFKSSSHLAVSLRNLFSLFVEVVLLQKISLFGYWNNVNMNLRFAGIAVVSLNGTMVIMLLTGENVLPLSTSHPVSTSTITAFGAIFATVFWQERSAYYSKWSYLANLYNEVLKAKPSMPQNALTAEYHSYRKSLDIALAMDIIQMEMWSHPSYEPIVTQALKDAYHLIQNREFKSNSEFYSVTKLLTKKDATALLYQLQKKYLTAESFEYRTSLLARAMQNGKVA